MINNLEEFKKKLIEYNNFLNEVLKIKEEISLIINNLEKLQKELKSNYELNNRNIYNEKVIEIENKLNVINKEINASIITKIDNNILEIKNEIIKANEILGEY